MRSRRTAIFAVAALGALALTVRQPTAEIRLATHEIGDPAPRQLQAALNLGVLGVKLIYTWTAASLR